MNLPRKRRPSLAERRRARTPPEFRKYDGLRLPAWVRVPRWPWWGWALAAGGIGLAILAFVKRKELAMLTGRVIQAGQELAFTAALPSEARPFAQVILQVARETKLDPFLLAAIGQRESRWGVALTPPGPGGTGDFAPRNWGPYPMPPDGLGWGRGIMQVDYGSYADWLLSHNWQDPITNVRKGAEILINKMRFFQARPAAGARVTLSASDAQRRGVQPGTYPDPRPLVGDALARAAIAAYNGGEGNVLKSIASKARFDSTTTGGDYSDDVVARVGKMASSFLSKIGAVT